MFERFTERARQVVVLAQEEARTLNHNYIGTEHILLGLVRGGEGVAVRILNDHDADPERVRNAVIRTLGDVEAPTFEPPRPRSPGFEPPGFHPDDPVAESEASLGWRGRPISLAALGAALLARSAFDPRRTGGLEPLEMQLLVRLALASADATAARQGEPQDSLTASLACDLDDLRLAVASLARQALIALEDEQDDDLRILITADGVGVVERWLRRAAPLFGTWPPDNPDADDATG